MKGNESPASLSERCKQHLLSALQWQRCANGLVEREKLLMSTSCFSDGWTIWQPIHKPFFIPPTLLWGWDICLGFVHFGSISRSEIVTKHLHGSPTSNFMLGLLGLLVAALRHHLQSRIGIARSFVPHWRPFSFRCSAQPPGKQMKWRRTVHSRCANRVEELMWSFIWHKHPAKALPSCPGQ